MNLPDQPVTIRHPLKSPINWVQVSALLGVLAVLIQDPGVGGVFLDMDQKLAALATISALQSITTVVLRTWFTGKPIENGKKHFSVFTIAAAIAAALKIIAGSSNGNGGHNGNNGNNGKQEENGT